VRRDIKDPEEYFSHMRWTKYVLTNGRECYLTQRPDSAKPSSVQEFIAEKKPIVRFQYTDDMVERPPNDPPVHWYPWAPCLNIPLECVYASCTLLDHYVNSKEPGSIWLHCDSSTMRAPTFFGLYLVTHFPVKTMLKICHNAEYSENSFEFANRSRADKYLRYSLRRDPGVKELVQAFQKEGNAGAHRYYNDRERE